MPLILFLVFIFFTVPSKSKKNSWFESLYHESAQFHVSDVSFSIGIGIKSIVSIYCMHSVTSSNFFHQHQTNIFYSIGSGIIYQLSAEGTAYIITSNQVIFRNCSSSTDEINDNILINLYGIEEEEYRIPAFYVGSSYTCGISILYINKSKILQNAIQKKTVCEVKFSDSNKFRIGQTVFSIGNSFGLGISAKIGILSSESEKNSLHFLQTDITINNGDSGGGLFDNTGKLIGLLVFSQNYNISTAISSNIVKVVSENIIYYKISMKKHSAMRAMLGIAFESRCSSTIIDKNGFVVKTEKTVVKAFTFYSILKDIMKEGDVIESIKVGKNIEKKITRKFQIIEILYEIRSEIPFVIKFYRGDKLMSSKFTITNNYLQES